MTAPETLEELRAALMRLADEHQAAAEDVTGRIAIGERAMHGTFVRRLVALLPPAPEPIKVGVRVEASNLAGTMGEVLGGPWTDSLGAGVEEVVVRWDDGMGLELMLVGDLTRVDSSPSPGREPEHGCPTCGSEAVLDAAGGVSCVACAYEAPAPPPSPEVGEGWRWLATAEALEEAFRTPGVTVAYTNDHQPGRWDVMDDDTAAHEDATVARGGDEGLAFWCRRWIEAGHTWRASDPLPKQQETPEPHESEDPEELAAAKDAGLTVDVDYTGTGLGRVSTCHGNASGFAHAVANGACFRIHGTVPGYEHTETGS